MNELNIGEQLRSLRKSLNLTTQEVANRVNISQSYISRFENNRSVPDVDMLAKILNALGTDLATFFSYSEDNQKIPEDLAQLIEMSKQLTPEERIKLTEFLTVLKRNP
ncbi:helix-turn-helix domain-containing protein [Gracilibacillus salitolerans]|uniref:Helix-turn-helix domain-containing protein n=1 Tax=Gracilibacillus salitolerans TaxID=2663022 RepID=A0A5Q2TMB6_9BACI|nr:helix-turn-helix transcriptional regulator [Gracilibacillus salitolerans]QGH36099.1 helix-turn-helix domain-containing protein [Gracilibacillus salitolerans]